MDNYREKWCGIFRSQKIGCGVIPYCVWNGTACSVDSELDLFESNRTTVDEYGVKGWSYGGYGGEGGDEVDLWAIFGIVVAAVFVVKVFFLFLGPPLYVRVKGFTEEKGTSCRKWWSKICPCLGEAREPEEAIPLVARSHGRPGYVAINII